MNINILGAESLGVRGLSCSIELNNRKVIIDPGVALGWSRHGLLPHPFQVAIGAGIRERIIEELKNATDIIISHFDGDHCPLYNANPYQMGILPINDTLSHCRIWAKGTNDSSPLQQRRRKELSEAINKDLPGSEGTKDDNIEFSYPVPHGEQGDKKSTVMMTKITEHGATFAHASDIQFLEERTIDALLDWKPDIVLASGPPLYHYSSSLFGTQREHAWENALRLSKHVDTLIIDHHLLRSEEGIAWLDRLKHTARNRILCAADFMKRQPLFLEAWRQELYELLPVNENWHEDYKQGKISADDYRIKGWEQLIRSKKVRPCKWYDACPVKYHTDRGGLERYWIENYCLVSNKNCIRYQMEESGRYHPDNMLPDGSIREGL